LTDEKRRRDLALITGDFTGSEGSGHCGGPECEMSRRLAITDRQRRVG